MDDMSLYISKETKEYREYLIDFYNRIDSMKSDGIKVDAYKIGMNEKPNFWGNYMRMKSYRKKNVKENLLELVKNIK